MPCKLSGKDTKFDRQVKAAATEQICSRKRLGAAASPNGRSIVRPKQARKDPKNRYNIQVGQQVGHRRREPSSLALPCDECLEEGLATEIVKVGTYW